MIDVYRLTKRHVEGNTNKDMPAPLKHIKVFSITIGHGVGTIDFTERVAQISDEDFDDIIKNSGEYTKFKLGNLKKYFEIEIFIEHAKLLIPDMCDCEFKNILTSLEEGYLVLKKL